MLFMYFAISCKGKGALSEQFVSDEGARGSDANRLLIYLETTSWERLFQKILTFSGLMSGFTRHSGHREAENNAGYQCLTVKTASCPVASRREILTSERMVVSEMKITPVSFLLPPSNNS